MQLSPINWLAMSDGVLPSSPPSSPPRTNRFLHNATTSSPDASRLYPHHSPMSRSPSSGLPSPTFPPPRLPPRSPARQLLAHLAHIPSSRHPSLQVSLRIASSLGQSGARHAVSEATLSEGDLIGEGLMLHGQPIRQVDMPSSPRDPSLAPASELQVIRKLGTGSYAVVFLVREVLRSIPSMASQDDLPVGQFEMGGHAPSTPTPFVRYGREFAVKCLSKASLTQEALEIQLLEARIHHSLPIHSNIVTLHRTLETASFLLLILESVPGQDLFFFLEQSKDHEPSSALSSGLVVAATSTSPPPTDSLAISIPGAASTTPPTPSLLSTLHPSQILSHRRLRLIASMFSQMCEAVHSCHQRGVSHRDIKPENFIVTDGMVPVKGRRDKLERRVIVKLSDFGLATTDAESCDMDCGSAPYMSFECRNNCAPSYETQPADVWSLGIVLINMLYHHNPWTDTCAGVCRSFEVYRSQPIEFFMSRFTGMTYDVAEFLANRVFCILNDDPHSAPPQRVDAHEFGMWVKNLPALLGDDCQTALSSRAPSLAPVPRPAHQMQSHSRQASATMSTFAERHWDLETERLDKQLASLVRQDSQHSSISQTAVARPRLRPISTSIQFSDFDSTVPATDAQPGLELEGEGDDDCLSPQTPGPELCSRSTSTNKRRKRGTRRGKAAHQQGGSANGVMSPITPSATPLSEYGGTFALGGVSSYASQDNLRDDARLANLAEGAQILARELSKKKLGATTPTPRSDHFSAIPTPPMPLVPALFASALQPAQLPPTPFFPPPSSNRTTSPPATQRLTKKPSKWNVFVRKETESPASNPLPGSASSLSLSSAVSGTAKPALSVRSNGSTERSTSASRGMSATAASVTTILMGLDAPPRSNNASRERSRSVARSTEREQEKKQILTYSSGNASSSSVGSSSLSWARGRRIEPHDLNWGPSSPPENAFGATVSNRRIPPVPLLPPSVVEQRDRWSNPTADRSPSSLRSARTSYAPSLESPNWRQSSQSAQSSTQSHGPGQQSQSSSSASSIAGASGFTRFSNASVRSVSTVATSISAGSALRYSMSKSSFVSTDEDHSFTPSVPVPTPREARRISPMVKNMDGIPWELDNFAPRYPGSPPNNNNMRIPTRKGVPAPLDTISERPRLPVPTSPPPRLNGSSASATVAKVYRCQDAATSTTDLDGEPSPSLSDLTSPKKVQKGQINALAKMLSALKTNRSGRE